MFGGKKTSLPSLKLTQPMKTPLFPCKYHQKGGFSMGYVSFREGKFIQEKELDLCYIVGG